MVTAVAFTVRAERELTEIVEHIAQDDEVAAFRLVADLRRSVSEKPRVFPDGGVKWHGERRLPTIRRYTFVYRHDAAKGEVVVMNVFGPGMDWR